MKKTTNLSRRRMLEWTLFGSGFLGLRSLASGIPVSVLADPRSAPRDLAAAAACPAVNPQYIILNSLGSGDPINANVPGMYLDPNVTHPLDPAMAPLPLTQNGVAATAATPWTQLPQWVLDRTLFLHHGTYTVVHSDINKVLTLEAAVVHQDMLVSMMAANLAPCLGTVQSEPLSLAPSIVYQGRPQPILPATALASLLADPGGMIGQLQSLRDADLNRLNALYKAEGNAAQKAFIDQYSLSQTQARSISDNLLTQLSTIKNNSALSQLTAAVTLIQMKVAPVIAVSIPFGGDNHTDNVAGVLFANETAQTISGVQNIATLQSMLQTAGIQDNVSFMSLNVFGRTLGRTDGRDHNSNHHCMVVIGKPFQGSVVGGIEPSGTNYQRAMSIDSATGHGVPAGAGDIPFAQTLAAAGKTVAIGAGVDPAVVDANITGGKVIGGALAKA
jgi:Protein of unknown function (DUF1501)